MLDTQFIEVRTYVGVKYNPSTTTVPSVVSAVSQATGNRYRKPDRVYVLRYIGGWDRQV